MIVGHSRCDTSIVAYSAWGSMSAEPAVGTSGAQAVQHRLVQLP